MERFLLHRYEIEYQIDDIVHRFKIDAFTVSDVITQIYVYLDDKHQGGRWVIKRIYPLTDRVGTDSGKIYD
jgi:hypothetical protein